jgi:ElaB/YqjD/DUF883 family membrane-anchored ribosome-binding protein
MLEHTAESSAALADELRNVVNQAEELLRAVGSDSNQAISALRDRVFEAVDTAKSRLSDLEQQAQRASQRMTTATETYIRENPWATLGIAVTAGLLLGALLAHRSSTSELE